MVQVQHHTGIGRDAHSRVPAAYRLRIALLELRVARLERTKTLPQEALETLAQLVEDAYVALADLPDYAVKALADKAAPWQPGEALRKGRIVKRGDAAYSVARAHTASGDAPPEEHAGKGELYEVIA